MASTERIFFAGVATTVVLIGAGFSGGVMLGKTAMDLPQTKAMQTVAPPQKLPPPARVVLPGGTEASAPIPFVPESAPFIQAMAPEVREPPSKLKSEQEVIPAEVVQLQKQDIEKERQSKQQAETKKQRVHSEQRKDAAERERQRRYVERRVRLDAAREQQQAQQRRQQEVHTQRESPGILALDEVDDPSGQSVFLGD